MNVENSESMKSLKKTTTTKNELKRRARLMKGNWRNGVIGVHVVDCTDGGFEVRSNARRERKRKKFLIQPF